MKILLAVLSVCILVCLRGADSADSCKTATDKPYCDAKFCAFPTIKKDCPIVCKTCSAVCTAPCKNNGTQDPDTCVCDCTDTGFMGEFCDQSEANALVLDCSIKRNGVAVYRGAQNTTNRGYTCQEWTSTKPHFHGYSDLYFKNTDGAFEEPVEAAENYCRDPSFGSHKPQGKLWCYNAGSGKRWDWCDKVVKEC